MDVTSCLYIFLCVTDGKAVFYNVLVRTDRAQSHLVSCGDILVKNDFRTVNGDFFACRSRRQRHGYVILFVYFKYVHVKLQNQASTSFATVAFTPSARKASR